MALQAAMSFLPSALSARKEVSRAPELYFFVHAFPPAGEHPGRGRGE